VLRHHLHHYCTEHAVPIIRVQPTREQAGTFSLRADVSCGGARRDPAEAGGAGEERKRKRQAGAPPAAGANEALGPLSAVACTLAPASVSAAVAPGGGAGGPGASAGSSPRASAVDRLEEEMGSRRRTGRPLPRAHVPAAAAAPTRGRAMPGWPPCPRRRL